MKVITINEPNQGLTARHYSSTKTMAETYEKLFVNLHQAKAIHGKIAAG
jgi:hypothetical protein